jgi:hypothetical protein
MQDDGSMDRLRDEATDDEKRQQTDIEKAHKDAEKAAASKDDKKDG